MRFEDFHNELLSIPENNRLWLENQSKNEFSLGKFFGSVVFYGSLIASAPAAIAMTNCSEIVLSRMDNLVFGVSVIILLVNIFFIIAGSAYCQDELNQSDIAKFDRHCFIDKRYQDGFIGVKKWEKLKNLLLGIGLASLTIANIYFSHWILAVVSLSAYVGSYSILKEVITIIRKRIRDIENDINVDYVLKSPK